MSRLPYSRNCGRRWSSCHGLGLMRRMLSCRFSFLSTLYVCLARRFRIESHNSHGIVLLPRPWDPPSSESESSSSESVSTSRLGSSCSTEHMKVKDILRSFEEVIDERSPSRGLGSFMKWRRSTWTSSSSLQDVRNTSGRARSDIVFSPGR